MKLFRLIKGALNVPFWTLALQVKRQNAQLVRSSLSKHDDQSLTQWAYVKSLFVTVTWVGNPRVLKEESPRDLFLGKLRPIRNPVSKLTINSTEVVSVSRGIITWGQLLVSTWKYMNTQVHSYPHTMCPHILHTCIYLHQFVHIHIHTHTHTKMYTERGKYHFCRTSFLPKKCSPILSVPKLCVCSHSEVAEWEIKPSSTDSRRAQLLALQAKQLWLLTRKITVMNGLSFRLCGCVYGAERRSLHLPYPLQPSLLRPKPLRGWRVPMLQNHPLLLCKVMLLTLYPIDSTGTATAAVQTRGCQGQPQAWWSDDSAD